MLRELQDVMQTCGSDFTNTFRDLAKLSKSEEISDEDAEVLKTLYKANSAPAEGLIATKKSRFSNEDSIRTMLEK